MAVLGFVVFYLYGLISFALLRSSFDPDNDLYCATLWQCTVTVIRYGLVGQIFDVRNISTLHCIVYHSILMSLWLNSFSLYVHYFHYKLFKVNLLLTSRTFFSTETEQPSCWKHVLKVWDTRCFPSLVLHFHHHHRTQHHFRHHRRHLLRAQGSQGDARVNKTMDWEVWFQLRRFQWTAERDMRDTCFICSRGSYDFEHHGMVGFLLALMSVEC